MTNEKLRAIKYVGRYKPRISYSIGNGLLIHPAGVEMVEYRFGASTTQMRLNVSYFASQNGIPETELTMQYRRWLTFDAFILEDDSPIRAFDMQITGHLGVIPDQTFDDPTHQDYYTQDYDNISGAIFGYSPDEPSLPKVSYSEIYHQYLKLSDKSKEMIEWYVSYPTYLDQVYNKPSVFFNQNYWQILHLVILLDKIIGQPISCQQSPKKCVYGRTHAPHYSKSKSEHLIQFLMSRIGISEIAEDYARIIQTAYKVRNPMAHMPYFDRSSHEAPLEQPEIYDTSRAITDYKDDSAALKLLITSLREVVRNLILNDAFGIIFFKPLKKLTSFPVR